MRRAAYHHGAHQGRHAGIPACRCRRTAARPASGCHRCLLGAAAWVGSHKNVHVILSGMSAEDQLTDNLATFGHFEPLSPAENAAVESVAKELHRRIKIGCTGCRYCMPCPMGVDIPDNFSIWNKLGMFGQKDAIKAQWTTCFPDSEKALHCVRCGKCEAVCPQKLPIRDSLAQLQKELDAL